MSARDPVMLAPIPRARRDGSRRIIRRRMVNWSADHWSARAGTSARVSGCRSMMCLTLRTILLARSCSAESTRIRSSGSLSRSHAQNTPSKVDFPALRKTRSSRRRSPRSQLRPSQVVILRCRAGVVWRWHRFQSQTNCGKLTAAKGVVSASFAALPTSRSRTAAQRGAPMTYRLTLRVPVSRFSM